MLDNYLSICAFFNTAENRLENNVGAIDKYSETLQPFFELICHELRENYSYTIKDITIKIRNASGLNLPSVFLEQFMRTSNCFEASNEGYRYIKVEKKTRT